MPIVDHARAREIPWRAGYRRWAVAGADEGVGCSLGISLIEPGAGAPLHRHAEADELIVVLDGTIEFRIGDERVVVGANHTVAIPAGTPHAFTVVGTAPARIMGFMPKLGAFAAAEYLEGGAPAAGAGRGI